MSNNPTQLSSWENLAKLSKTRINLNDLFLKNRKRFEDFSVEDNGVFLDFSKQLINEEILKNLAGLLDETGFIDKRDKMFSGQKINTTEDRAVLHTALRAPHTVKIKVDGKDIIPDIHHTLDRMKALSVQVRSGEYIGATGKAITNIVSIGIGGSDLGPRMVYNALNDHKQPVKTYYVSTIDPDEIDGVLQACDPEATLFIVVSKSFGTQETLTNSLFAQKWLQQNLPAGSDINKHFIAVTANIDAAIKFGITEQNIFPMWDWVSGRFSLWSAVGLSLAIGLGFDQFQKLLRGARAMDEHFKSTPLIKNIPVLAALMGIWNRNFLNLSSHVVLPYIQKLSGLPAYLQQLEMESNGKHTDLDGNIITDYQTCPVIFGEVGTNAQHSFYQLFHQGRDIIPADFILSLKTSQPKDERHDLINANMLAQGQAMMQGKQSQNNNHSQIDGNRPSTTLLLDKMDAQHLGMLLALYEHKVFVQGHIWNINSFDQFGVELGKKMANKILEKDLSSLDSSTKGLYSRIYKNIN